MIKVFGKEGCSKCDSLKKTLDNRGIEYEYIQDLKTLMTVASKNRMHQLLKKMESIIQWKNF